MDPQGLDPQGQGSMHPFPLLVTTGLEESFLTIAVDDVQKRWANLRDTFMMCKRKYESSVASGMSAPEPKWKWWTSMDWYLEYRRKKE